VIVAAVPVKDLVNAKQRLMAVLTAEERSALARTMLRDVLRMLGRARLDQVWLVTRDAEVTAIGRELGARIVGESENRGHTAAVKTAQDGAVGAGATIFVTVPGDVPCARAEEVDALVAAARSGGRTAVFAPSRSGLGTNGVALAPPDVMPLRFGEPSFPDHLASARQHGLEPLTLTLPGLGLDVDDADDLRALLAKGTGTESAALLRSWSISERLGSDADRAHA